MSAGVIVVSPIYHTDELQTFDNSSASELLVGTEALADSSAGRCSANATGILGSPMKYSLRSLMIVVTVAGILLGTGMRMRHAHQRAKYHWKQANYFGDLLFRTPHEERGKHTEWKSGFRRHCHFAQAYEQAVYRPWVIVDETSP